MEGSDHRHGRATSGADLADRGDGSGSSAEDQFEEEFDDLFGRSYALAYRMLGNGAAAEDVAAEALARTFSRWSKVRELPHRRAWVLRVTTNLAIDETRRRRPRLEPVGETNFEETSALRMALAAALGRLPRRQREAVTLHYLSDMATDEVSQCLGISASSVKTHVQRGLSALRLRLASDGQELAI